MSDDHALSDERPLSGDAYVTRSAWVRTLGRPDAVDEIADQFERPAPAGRSAADAGRGWPLRARGWAERGRLLSPSQVRRAS